MDAYYGNNHLFNPSTFASSKQFWTTSVLSAQQLANSKLARQIDSRAFNPTYTFTATMEQFSLGELAAPIIAFGDSEAGTADRALVEYFFGMLGALGVEAVFLECLGVLTRFVRRERTPPDVAGVEQEGEAGDSAGDLAGCSAYSERDEPHHWKQHRGQCVRSRDSGAAFRWR